jgi:thymidylate synthase
MVSTWHFAYCVNNENRRVVVAPCHGDLLQWIIDTDQQTISLRHVQRSFDSLVGGVGNIAQYAALLLCSAKILGYRAHKLIYKVLDPHYYSIQLEELKEILSREPRPFPKVWLDADIASVKEMRPEHFRIEEYHPHPAMYIPTPV